MSISFSPLLSTWISYLLSAHSVKGWQIITVRQMMKNIPHHLGVFTVTLAVRWRQLSWRKTFLERTPYSFFFRAGFMYFYSKTPAWKQVSNLSHSDDSLLYRYHTLQFFMITNLCLHSTNRFLSEANWRTHDLSNITILFEIIIPHFDIADSAPEVKIKFPLALN
jgi:hypothetical protein